MQVPEVNDDTDLSLRATVEDAMRRRRTDPHLCPYCGLRDRHWDCPLLASWWEVRGLSLAPQRLSLTF